MLQHDGDLAAANYVGIVGERDGRVTKNSRMPLRREQFRGK